MHHFKTMLKYNKKVYIVPHDKLHTILPDADHFKEDTSAQSPKSEIKSGEATRSEPGLKSEKLDGAGTTEDWRSLLTPKQLNNALAIKHILGFQPESDKEDRAYLLYTQLDSPTPSNVIDLYHRISDKDIPVHLIANKRLRRNIRRMRKLQEDAHEDSEDDESDTSTDGDASGEERSLPKGLGLYDNKALRLKLKQSKGNKTLVKRKKRLKRGSLEVGQLGVSGGDSHANGRGAPETSAAQDSAWLHIF